MSEGSRRAAARIAAPAVFLVAVTIAVLLVRAGLDDTPDDPVPAAPATVATRTTVVVRQGDTLASIATESGTTVAELRRLNPDVDPVQLEPGREIRVR